MDDTGPMLFTNMSTSTTVGLTTKKEKNPHKLLIEPFHRGPPLDSFQTPERRIEAGIDEPLLF